MIARLIAGVLGGLGSAIWAFSAGSGIWLALLVYSLAGAAAVLLACLPLFFDSAPDEVAELSGRPA